MSRMMVLCSPSWVELVEFQKVEVFQMRDLAEAGSAKMSPAVMVASGQALLCS